jgi:hypothetical protein
MQLVAQDMHKCSAQGRSVCFAPNTARATDRSRKIHSKKVIQLTSLCVRVLSAMSGAAATSNMKSFGTGDPRHVFDESKHFIHHPHVLEG